MITKAWKPIAALWLAGLVALAFPDLAAAQAKLTISPAGVTVSPGTSERFLVKLEGAPPGAASLAIEGSPSIDAGIAPAPASAQAARQWLVTLKAGTEFNEDTTAILRAEVGGQTITEPLAIKFKARASAESQIKAELSFEGETLFDGNPRPLLARVTNLSDAPLDVTLTPRLPPFIVVGDGAQLTAQVPARSSTVLDIPVKTHGVTDHPVLSGKHQVFVTVEAVRAGPSPWRGRIVAAATLPVGIPGMSEVQGILQVPSFLLLPGFLLISAFVLTRRILEPSAATGKEASPLAVGWNSGLWVIAITFSMALVWAYPYVTAALPGGSSRSILYGFDLSDVLRVWILSLAGGAAGGAAWAGLRKWWASQKAKAEFSDILEPLELLDRLAFHNISATRPFLALPASADERVYKLGPTEGDKSWVSSAILLKIIDPTSTAFNMIEHSKLSKRGGAAEIAKYLRAAIEAKAIVIYWASASGVRGVTLYETAKLVKLDPAESIIKQAP